MASYSFDSYSIGYSVHENSAPQDLVVLNGNLATSRWWIPTMEAFKARFDHQEMKGRVIFLELPGCGESSTVEGDLSVPTIAHQYLEILSHLNIQSAHIMGHSTGGLLSCWLMALKPSLFKKALLLDPVGPRGIQFDDAVLSTYEEMKRSRELTAEIIAYTIHNCDKSSAFFQQVIAEDTFRSVQQVGSKMICALRGYDSTEQIKKIQNEVTILCGEHDFLLPKADMQELAQQLSHSRFIEVPGAGHCLNVENPQAMADAIHKYLF